MLTRSAKVYEFTSTVNNNSKTTYHCSFCNGTDHKINRCNSPEIEALHKKTLEATIFNRFVSLSSQYILFIWLEELSIKQLQVLCYRFDRRITLNKNRVSYITELQNRYFNEELPDVISKDLLDEISDENYNYFKELWISKQPHLFRDIVRITNRLRPIQRKFCIRPLLVLNCDDCFKSCPICLTDDICSSKMISTSCDHEYCSSCFITYLKSLNTEPCKEPSCALCRSNITSLKIKNEDLFKEYNEKYCEEQRVPTLKQHQKELLIQVFYHFIGF